MSPSQWKVFYFKAGMVTEHRSETISTNPNTEAGLVHRFLQKGHWTNTAGRGG